MRYQPEPDLRAAVEWFFASKVGGQPSDVVPFYCDPARLGAFAVAPERLAIGEDSAVFKLFIALSMYQALRDVVVMRQQHELPRASVRVVADLALLKRVIERHPCPMFDAASAFEEGCDVSKVSGIVDCGRCPGIACHVKDATVVFNRMGDMGKLPTSAVLRVWKSGTTGELLEAVCRDVASPSKRATLLVERFARVYRVGRKLATMFVSALSTPALAPGLTPWFPAIDGNELVVIDTNVARAVDNLRKPGASRTYDAREGWVREQASHLDLRRIRPDLPSHSPRLVQQALYAFCSKSNRVVAEDPCARRTSECTRCGPAICPFRRGH